MILVKNFKDYVSIEEAQEAVKGLTIPSQLGGYSFTGSSLFWKGYPMIDTIMNGERNHVYNYEGDITIDDLGEWTLYYRGEENDGFKIRINNKDFAPNYASLEGSSDTKEQTEIDGKIYTSHKIVGSLAIVTDIALGLK